MILELRRKHKILMSAEGPLGNILKFKPPMVFTRADADNVRPPLLHSRDHRKLSKGRDFQMVGALDEVLSRRQKSQKA